MERQLEFYSPTKKLKTLQQQNREDAALELNLLSEIDLIEILKSYYYKTYKTGLTFKRVRQMLYQEQTQRINSGDSMFVTRHTVLGRWHQIKQLEFQTLYYNYFENLSREDAINEILSIIYKSTS